MSSKSMPLTTTHVLAPMALMALTMALFFVFQLTQVMKDRDGLNQAFGRQEEPVAQSEKLNAQFSGLVTGLNALSDKGNVTAKDLMEKLRQAGVMTQPPAQQSSAPVPAAKDVPNGGPVKP